MAGRKAFFGEDRAGGKRQRRLGDVVGRVGLQLFGEGLAFLPAGGWADKHAVAAGTMDFLDHEAGQMFQHIGQAVGLRAAPCRHVWQDSLAAGVEFHDFRHVGVDRLVVGNACARGIGNGEAAGAVDIHDAGHAERGIGAEGEGVEEVIVDAAVQDIDRLVAGGGAHGHAAVLDAQVGAFHQLTAHLVGQEGMLEIGGIVDAGRQHRHGGPAVACRRRHGFQRAAQKLRIILHRAHSDVAKQLGEELHHRLAVLQHVGNARRRAGIVLQNVEFMLAGAHDIGADDVGVDAAGRLHAQHFGQESLVAGNQLDGNAARLDDFLAVVDVVQKGVERDDALFDALGQPPPLGTGKDARHDVEGDQALCGLSLAIDIEGDARAPENLFGIRALALQVFRRLARVPIVIALVGPAGVFILSHLIERCHEYAPLLPEHGEFFSSC